MTALSGALKSLWAVINRPPHDYVPSTQRFLDLNVGKIAEDHNLRKEAKERAEQDRPDPTTDALDDVEQEIITYCLHQRQLDHAQFAELLQTYQERLAVLNVEGFVHQIKISASEAVVAFNTDVHKGLDDLHRLRHYVIDREQDLTQFKNDNGIKRSPNYPDTHYLHAGFLALILLIEALANGSMLAVGNVFGLLGGVSQALLIAVINVSLGFVLGRHVLPQLLHRSLKRRRASWIAAPVLLLLSLAFNLAVAHYRDALSGPLPQLAGHTALHTLMVAPFAVADLQSWMLMLLGVAFSWSAAFDGFRWDDPYPGYGPLARRRDQAEAEYVAEKEQLLEQLEEEREQAIKAMSQAQADAQKRQAEYSAIISGRQTLISQFRARETYLQQVANQLLSIYRQENARHRRVVPAHFSATWQFPDVLSPGPDAVSQPTTIDHLQSQVASLAQVLSDSAEKVQAAYGDAIKEYRRIDQLTESTD